MVQYRPFSETFNTMKRKRQKSRAWAKRDSRPTKRINNNKDDKDRISTLPDDIVGNIVSLLSMKDAVRTSMLSRRWKKMHAYKSKLEFDWSDITSRGTFAKKRAALYIRTVTRYLSAYLGTKIESFKLSCCIGSQYGIHINGWVDYAVKKGVQTLDLAFTTDDVCESSFDSRTVDYYHFPTHLLLRSEHSKPRHLSLRTCTLNSDFGDRFSKLSTLVLCDVNLAGHVKPQVFCVCANLESLTLQWCFGLDSLVIDDSLHRLRTLTVRMCKGLKKIHLTSTTLTTFQYVAGSENQAEFSFARVPNLEKVHVMVEPIASVLRTFDQIEEELFLKSRL